MASNVVYTFNPKDNSFWIIVGVRADVNGEILFLITDQNRRKTDTVSCKSKLVNENPVVRANIRKSVRRTRDYFKKLTLPSGDQPSLLIEDY